MILQFHNDGYFKEDSYLYYGNFNYKRNKKSAAYGGKYYLSKNSIFVESFYPTSGSKTKYYERVISKGMIKNDTIEIVFFGRKNKYVKKKFNQIF